MKKNFVLSALFGAVLSLGFTNIAQAQCDAMLIFKEGTATTMTHYDAKGKITGSTKIVYQDVKKEGNDVSVKALESNYDKKGALAGSADFTIKCSGGTLFFDMKMYVPQQQEDAYKDMEMTVEGTDLEMPSALVVGNQLKDANMKFSFKSKDVPMPAMKTEIIITNRKVEAKETITTPAGSFECYKISENAEVKSIFSMKTRTISWFNTEVGNVKVESYKENGKLSSKSELTELKK